MSSEYKKIWKFALKYQNIIDDSEREAGGNELAPGLYLQAFADGIIDSLQVFQKSVVELEKKYLKKPNYLKQWWRTRIIPARGCSERSCSLLLWNIILCYFPTSYQEHHKVLCCVFFCILLISGISSSNIRQWLYSYLTQKPLSIFWSYNVEITKKLVCLLKCENIFLTKGYVPKLFKAEIGSFDPVPLPRKALQKFHTPSHLKRYVICERPQGKKFFLEANNFSSSNNSPVGRLSNCGSILFLAHHSCKKDLISCGIFNGQLLKYFKLFFASKILRKKCRKINIVTDVWSWGSSI